MAGTDRDKTLIMDGPVIILVEPQLGENIGMVARAMANFGLSELRLVNPREQWPNDKARAAASKADHVIDGATVHASLADAIGDLNHVLATTARERDGFKPVLGPAEAARGMRVRHVGGERTGLLFGRERFGLYNEEIGLADAIVTFPVNPAFASLNIAQAVLLVAYEWMKASLEEGREAPFPGPEFVPAPKESLIGLFGQVETALDTRGYFRPPAKKPKMVDNLRAVLTRPAFSEKEIQVLRGVVASLDRFTPAYPRGAARPPDVPGVALATASDRPVLVFDSGIGGLSVLREARVLMPDRSFAYVADDAAFPYGAWEEPALRDRILALFAKLFERFDPEISVIACNTASTLVIGALREAFPGRQFVGTVPAIKPAAERTVSGLVSVLATPGTVKRQYTRDLIAQWASRCHVRLVGSERLASLAETYMREGFVDEQAVREEIEPCFIEHDGRRTDIVVLACTHYPFLVNRMRKTAPWPVDWIDPAEAIARRALSLLEPVDGESPKGADIALFTSGSPHPAIGRLVRGFGLFPADW